MDSTKWAQRMQRLLLLFIIYLICLIIIYYYYVLGRRGIQQNPLDKEETDKANSALAG